MNTRRVLLPFLALATLAGATACEPRQPRAPFLCCVLTCTQGLVTAGKEIPDQTDGGWNCGRGLPIAYEATCSPEDTSECEQEDPGMQGGGGGGVLDGGLLDGGPLDAGTPDTHG